MTKNEEIAISILDIIEDFLEANNIEIDNEDKQDAIRQGEDPDNICVLYGTDYYDLQDKIVHILESKDPSTDVAIPTNQFLKEQLSMSKADIGAMYAPLEETTDYIRLAKKI